MFRQRWNVYIIRLPLVEIGRFTMNIYNPFYCIWMFFFEEIIIYDNHKMIYGNGDIWPLSEITYSMKNSFFLIRILLIQLNTRFECITIRFMLSIFDLLTYLWARKTRPQVLNELCYIKITQFFVLLRSCIDFDICFKVERFFEKKKIQKNSWFQALSNNC